MKIFIICGEKSGNNIIQQILSHLSEIIKQDNIIQQPIEINGVFGNNIVNQFKQNFNISNILQYQDIELFGFSEILLNLPIIIDKITFICKKIEQFEPDLIITIDSYELSIMIAKRMRKKINNKKFKNTKIWHIVSPSVWAYFPKRANIIAKYYNILFYFLPFEKKYFQKLERKETIYNKGFQSIFTGFPATFQKTDDFCIKKNHLIGITLGSRISEVNRHKHLILDTIIKLKLINKQYNFVIFATENTYEMIKKYFCDIKNIEIVINEEEKKKKIKECYVVIAKNGTNTIEIGALNTAMIVYYKTSKLTYFFIKIFVKIKLFNLYNIVLNQQNIPEFLQQNATSENLVTATQLLLNNKNIRNQQIINTKKAINMMQNNNTHPTEIIAKHIIQNISNI